MGDHPESLATHVRGLVKETGQRLTYWQCLLKLASALARQQCPVVVNDEALCIWASAGLGSKNAVRASFTPTRRSTYIS